MATSQKHFVTAIIVSHDGALWLPEVVASIAKQRREIDQVIAIDTASTDSSVKLLKSAGITTLTTDRDKGFGAAIQEVLASTKLSPSILFNCLDEVVFGTVWQAYAKHIRSGKQNKLLILDEYIPNG